MAWSSRHVFVYQEVPTAANLNTNFANLDETAPAKATTKGDMFAATGANAIARVAPPTPLYWSPIYDTAESAGVRYAPQPVVLSSSYTSNTVSGTAAETDTWSYTLPANTLPSKGRLLLSWGVVFQSNSGPLAHTYKFYFGGVAYSMTTPSITASATNVMTFRFMVEIVALNATNSQRVMCLPFFVGSATAGTSVTLYSATNTGAATVDTTASAVLKFSVTHGGSSGTISSEVFPPTILLIPSMT
jgi:hypothetical protein